MMGHEGHHTLESCVLSVSAGATAERTSSAGGTLVSELERLAALHRSGDLTADEFDRAKNLVLPGPSD
jgi:hypothetical protein